MIVLDASAAVEYLLVIRAGERIAARLADEAIHAPHLLDIEVTHVLRGYVSRRQISAARGAEALEDLASLRARRYAHTRLLPRIWELRPNLTAYDAAYIALAEALDAPLVTADARVSRAPGHRARVELYETLTSRRA